MTDIENHVSSKSTNVPVKKETMALLASSSLTRDQMAGLTGDQLASLTRDQLAWLTSEQLAGLTGNYNIPKVENLYSRMLDGLNTHIRTLNQDTYGPEEPPLDICDTPMCIAGHTVHLAGEAGYALKDNLGFPLAARLIHDASRPDAVPPRYDTYPTPWALAYIEVRAAEEAQASKGKENEHPIAQ